MKIRIEVDVKDGSTIGNALAGLLKSGLLKPNGNSVAKLVEEKVKAKIPIPRSKTPDAKLREKILSILGKKGNLTSIQIRRQLPDKMRELRGHRISVILHSLVKKKQVKFTGGRGSRVYRLA